MPGISGNELILRVRGEYPELPILVLSMHHEPQIAHHALKAGASGYLTKDSDPETLIAAIHKVAHGGRFIAPQLAEAIAFESSMPAAAARHECLTERELAIMRLLAKGHGINDIADVLSISNKTVSTHKSRLMEKMGFSSVADLVRYTVSHGIRV
jgi:DNA-binding NarL/FixJ family response regulator